MRKAEKILAILTAWILRDIFGFVPKLRGSAMGTGLFHLPIRPFPRPPLDTFSPTSEKFFSFFPCLLPAVYCLMRFLGLFPKSKRNVLIAPGSARAGIGSARILLGSVRAAPGSARVSLVSVRIAQGTAPILQGCQSVMVAGCQGKTRGMGSLQGVLPKSVSPKI